MTIWNAFVALLRDMLVALWRIGDEPRSPYREPVRACEGGPIHEQRKCVCYMLTRSSYEDIADPSVGNVSIPRGENPVVTFRRVANRIGLGLNDDIRNELDRLERYCDEPVRIEAHSERQNIIDAINFEVEQAIVFAVRYMRGGEGSGSSTAMLAHEIYSNYEPSEEAKQLIEEKITAYKEALLDDSDKGKIAGSTAE